MESLQALAALKEQLRQHLAAVEKEEQSASESLRPQTLEQAADLETKLQEALDELKGWRAELEKTEAGKKK